MDSIPGWDRYDWLREETEQHRMMKAGTLVLSDITQMRVKEVC